MAKVKAKVEPGAKAKHELLRGRADVDISLSRLRTGAWGEGEGEFIAVELLPMLRTLAKARRRAHIEHGVYAVRVYVIPYDLKGVKLG